MGGVAGVQRGKIGPLPYLQTYTLFSQQCRATARFLRKVTQSRDQGWRKTDQAGCYSSGSGTG